MGIKCVSFFLSFAGSHCQHEHFTPVALKNVTGVEKIGLHKRDTRVNAFMVKQSESIAQMQLLHFFLQNLSLARVPKLINERFS